MHTNIIIHDGEHAIFFGAAEDSLDPTELGFPGAESERGPLLMSSMELEHKFDVWRDFHFVEAFHAQDDPKSICLQWRVTPEVLRQLEDIADGDYGIAVMPIAFMLEEGSVEVQAILRSLADAPADQVTDQLIDSEGSRVDPPVYENGMMEVDGYLINVDPSN